MKVILISLFCFISTISLLANFQSESSTITPEIQKRMYYSWKENNPIPLEDLRYITVLHWGFDDVVHRGELVVHKNVALEVIEIFEELYNEKFPIEKMILIDEYFANDEASMEDNNSSAFCSRPITGTTNRFSLHSYGIAIDINPKINPYVKGEVVLPESGRAYLNRDQSVQGIINMDSCCYKIFKSKGWVWGGNWKSPKDYQHFEKDLEVINNA